MKRKNFRKLITQPEK